MRVVVLAGVALAKIARSDDGAIAGERVETQMGKMCRIEDNLEVNGQRGGAIFRTVFATDACSSCQVLNIASHANIGDAHHFAHGIEAKRTDHLLTPEDAGRHCMCTVEGQLLLAFRAAPGAGQCTPLACFVHYIEVVERKVLGGRVGKTALFQLNIRRGGNNDPEAWTQQCCEPGDESCNIPEGTEEGHTIAALGRLLGEEVEAEDDAFTRWHCTPAFCSIGDATVPADAGLQCELHRSDTKVVLENEELCGERPDCKETGPSCRLGFENGERVACAGSDCYTEHFDAAVAALTAAAGSDFCLESPAE